MDPINTNTTTNNVGDAKKKVDSKRQTMGRRKIPLDRKIEKKSNLQVTFTKRRQGLFRKASELAVLCGLDMAILVRSPAGKIYVLGNPSADAVMKRFEGEGEPSSRQIVEHLEGRTESMDLPQLEEKKDPMCWEKPYESMDLPELEQYALELRAFAASRCLSV